MTTEPKFVPDEAVKISLPDNTTLRVKAIDKEIYNKAVQMIVSAKEKVQPVNRKEILATA